MAEQVFSPSPKSTIVCQHGAVKALRGMLYGSWLVPVAFVSELLKFCVCYSNSSLSGALPSEVGCQVSGSASLSFLRWPVVARWIRAQQNDALGPTKHEENINRPLTLASSACPLQGSSTAEEPPPGSPSGPAIHATQHPHAQTCNAEFSIILTWGFFLSVGTLSYGPSPPTLSGILESEKQSCLTLPEPQQIKAWRSNSEEATGTD
ncbi:hypothetical protein QQF64_025306 [Cirrhinus molitorella]|uniref:Uncharacterized protein n=1 Tax=Cirrhinus molitorella TaxID=172907 RepID=A0ABR3NPN1_9TELE